MEVNCPKCPQCWEDDIKLQDYGNNAAFSSLYDWYLCRKCFIDIPILKEKKNETN